MRKAKMTLLNERTAFLLRVVKKLEEVSFLS